MGGAGFSGNEIKEFTSMHIKICKTLNETNYYIINFKNKKNLIVNVDLKTER